MWHLIVESEPALGEAGRAWLGWAWHPAKAEMGDGNPTQQAAQAEAAGVLAWVRGWLMV